MSQIFLRSWIAVPLLALAACGGLRTDPAVTPDFVVRDAAIVIQSDAAFTRSADFPARVESTIQAALGYWGGNWSNLAGTTIVFAGTSHVACAGNDGSTGCYDGDIRLSTLDAGRTVSCVEATVLVHEVGHAVIGDAGHTDPRWMDFTSLAEHLVGRPGYDASGPTSCEPVANVWRHPPRG
jgi:hypothetical protein